MKEGADAFPCRCSHAEAAAPQPTQDWSTRRYSLNHESGLPPSLMEAPLLFPEGSTDKNSLLINVSGSALMHVQL